MHCIKSEDEMNEYWQHKLGISNHDWENSLEKLILGPIQDSILVLTLNLQFKLLEGLEHLSAPTPSLPFMFLRHTIENDLSSSIEDRSRIENLCFDMLL